jgi:hypothetical protein
MPNPLPVSFFYRKLYWVFSCFPHSIILLITSGHRTFNIVRRQRCMKDCSFCVMKLVTFHVSQPYNKTAFTLLLKIFNLVFIPIFLFFQILYGCANATFAFLMRLVASSSAPLLPVTILPSFPVRYEVNLYILQNSAFCPHSVFVCSVWFSQ